MGYARVQVELLNDSLLPEDSSTNTWYFVTPGAVADSGDEIAALLDTFYETIDQYLSEELSGAMNGRVYDLEDAKPRPPVYEWANTLTLGGVGYPNEICVCASFQGPVVAGANQARRRGRHYLGPLVATAGTSSVGDIRVAGALRTAVTGAYDVLATDATTPGLIWSVFSPTTAGPEPWGPTDLAAAMTTVTNGWVDDAFDVQRRRGLAPATRTTWTAGA